ncbi:hypothetical protein ABZU25_21635 [Micromonospora sp. NPDC005215]|uniref:hypothetical protein n=1 Tax=Micromonospora sp. NPDC005215 TaxID=3157024 RepID=UPI0033BC8A38
MNPDLAGQPLDDDDHAMLDQLAVLYGHLDPPPTDLDDRVRFAIGLRHLAIEVAGLATQQQPVGAARSGERTRTTTFATPSRTIMISMVDRPDGSVRIDGWLAPAAALRVELRFPEPAPSQLVTADETGRFVFDPVPHGLVQLLCHPEEGVDGPLLVTPSFAL